MTEIEILRERVERRTRAIDSLTSWLLHRFGPNSPEGREALCARDKLNDTVEPSG